MLYIIQEIFFRLHQGLGFNDHARTFSSLLLAEIDKRNLVGIKRLHDDLRVTATQVVNVAGTKLQLLKDYNCSRIKTAEKIKIDWRSRILT
ncbi:hypothetical protein Tco_0188592 [Tanacetum coccineum]